MRRSETDRGRAVAEAPGPDESGGGVGVARVARRPGERDRHAPFARYVGTGVGRGRDVGDIDPGARDRRMSGVVGRAYVDAERGGAVVGDERDARAGGLEGAVSVEVPGERHRRAGLWSNPLR